MSTENPTATASPQAITYASAGVDTAAGDRAVELMKASVAATMTPAVVGGVGGFAGMVDVSELRAYRRPLLATSTDGVGTKVAIAQALDVHHTIGQDLVGMVVDDIAVTGARPLLMTDYIACGHVVPERIADIVRGVAQACAAVHTPLLGGETAEHPGLMAPHEYDVAGAATGVVEADRLLGAERVRPGDVLVALAASGLHSNGYSLVRRVVEHAGWGLEREVPEFGRTLGEELLEPTRLYSALCLELVDAVDPTDADPTALRLHAFSHITGGGLAANLARVLPAGLVADVDRSTWQVPTVFDLVRRLGSVPWEDLEGTLNLGVGMVAVVAPEAVETVVRVAQGAGVPAWLLGRVHAGADYRARGRVVAGTKGVDGGAVDIFGSYRTA
ncbi:Phosphoribosylformylglycinamidine cyclo-ligase [Actinomyces bovis]|uniref:Phosphoribosylformylglycinamidine cyclo-ligase n=1 Tax=Actinomyces bovis TaxID=1658 RepID=A0ABY1VNF9_9ACTO|nr:phosphoribosylformylglycinamidine cyclo-ligase [Actinomyces bovis]SPT53525.1 Phosphoribosylformylglycinamidine cyclo-ligase [Actinomyces bovis]VEG55471.1 Phosphoribosylformylglycinamidine cyclo-ligase [Actinomyces israelii]